MGAFGLGQTITRREDERFTQGSGQYTDDLELPDQCVAYFFRSPFAHGRIVELDVAAARAAEAIIAVYTAQDLLAAGVRDLAGSSIPASSVSEARPALQQPPLARDVVRYVGEPVVAIVAENLFAAKDAAEMIEFDVEEFDAVVTPIDALAADTPAIHANVPGNRFGVLEYGDRAATDAVFEKAAHTTEIEIINNRLAPTAMEPRGCLASFDREANKMTVYQGCQGVHSLRSRILQSLDLDNLHVISPDVGGAFGLKIFLQCETVVTIFASLKLERPVKWIADRSESFLADLHGRDHVSRASLAMDEGGRFSAIRVSIDANLGAYSSQAGAFIPWFGACMSAGCYDIPTGYVDVTMAVTNTVPVDAYRGAGRPEAAYLIERLVDSAARKLGIGRDEIRRRNFLKPEDFPYRTFTGRQYDSGDYTRLMDSAIARADWNHFESRRTESAANGKLRGIGLAYYVEICSALGGEQTHIKFEKNGRVTVLVGTQSSGQGHETSFAQMVAAGLGIDSDLIDIVQGDSERIPSGEGTGGSRTMAIAGSALYRTVERVIDSGQQMASELLEVATPDLEFADGQFRIVGTDRSIDIGAVAAASYEQRSGTVTEGLYSAESFTPEAGTFPNGCHICEVEIDPQTGALDILRYTIEDDVGAVVNPLLLEGQIVGGVAQGLGQACGEHAVYDHDSGQLMTATFMDYCMPRCDWIPDVEFRYQEIPSPRNPLGIKGAGEAGTVGAAPALVNAVIDALEVRGIDHINMPVTPLSIWQALQRR